GRGPLPDQTLERIHFVLILMMPAEPIAFDTRAERHRFPTIRSELQMSDAYLTARVALLLHRPPETRAETGIMSGSGHKPDLPECPLFSRYQGQSRR
ncbi:MAG: hypothetical protein QOJ17_5988, partial [Rhodospirillaceae bacterium]|nr:hypothetical protein [Rhodospirillaceae bacterium]